MRPLKVSGPPPRDVDDHRRFVIDCGECPQPVGEVVAGMCPAAASCMICSRLGLVRSCRTVRARSPSRVSTHSALQRGSSAAACNARPAALCPVPMSADRTPDEGFAAALAVSVLTTAVVEAITPNLRSEASVDDNPVPAGCVLIRGSGG